MNGFMSRQPPELSAATGSELFEGNASLVHCPRCVWGWRVEGRGIGGSSKPKIKIADRLATFKKGLPKPSVTQSELSEPPVL